MKASDTHNNRITGILLVPTAGKDIRGACRLLLTVSCLTCLLLCLLTSSAIAGSSSAPTTWRTWVFSAHRFGSFCVPSWPCLGLALPAKSAEPKKGENGEGNKTDIAAGSKSDLARTDEAK